METTESMEGGGIFDGIGTGLNTWWRNVGRDNLGYPKPWNVIGRYRTKTYYPPTRYVAPLPQASDVNAQAAVNQLNQSIMELQNTYAGVYNAATAIGKSNGEMSQTVANISALVNDIHSHVQALYSKIGSLTQLRNNVNTLIQQNDHLMANLQNDRTILERLKADRATLEQTSAGLLNNIVNATNFINNMKASIVSLNLNNTNTPQMAAALKQIMNQLRIINGTIMTVDGSGAAPVPGMGMGMGMGMGTGMAMPGVFPYGPGAPMGAERPDWMGQVQPNAMPYGLGVGQMNNMPYEMKQWMGPDLVAQHKQNKFYNLEQFGQPGAVPGMAPNMMAPNMMAPGMMMPGMMMPGMMAPGMMAPGMQAAAPESSVKRADGSTSPPDAVSDYNYYQDFDPNNDIDMAAMRGKRGNDGVYRKLEAKDRVGPYAPHDKMGEKESLAKYGDFAKYGKYEVPGRNEIVGDSDAPMGLYGIVSGQKPVALNVHGVPLEGDKNRRFEKQVYLPKGKDARLLYKPHHEVPDIMDLKNKQIQSSSLDVVGHNKVDAATAALTEFKSKQRRNNQQLNAKKISDSGVRTPTPGRQGDELKPGHVRIKMDNPNVSTPEFKDVDESSVSLRGKQLVKDLTEANHYMTNLQNDYIFYSRLLKREDLSELNRRKANGMLNAIVNDAQNTKFNIEKMRGLLHHLVWNEDKKEHKFINLPGVKQQLINLDIIKGRKTINVDSPALASPYIKSTSAPNSSEIDDELKYHIIGWDNDSTPEAKRELRHARALQREKQRKRENLVLKDWAQKQAALVADSNDAKWWKRRQQRDEAVLKEFQERMATLKKGEPLPEKVSTPSTEPGVIQELNRLVQTAVPETIAMVPKTIAAVNRTINPFHIPTDHSDDLEYAKKAAYEQRAADALLEQQLKRQIVNKNFIPPPNFVRRDIELKEQGKPINYEPRISKSKDEKNEKNEKKIPIIRREVDDNLPYDLVENYGYNQPEKNAAAPEPAPQYNNPKPTQPQQQQQQQQSKKYPFKPGQGNNKYQNIKNAWKNKNQKGGYIYSKTNSDKLTRDSFWSRRPAITRRQKHHAAHSIRRHKR